MTFLAWQIYLHFSKIEHGQKYAPVQDSPVRNGVLWLGKTTEHLSTTHNTLGLGIRSSVLIFHINSIKVYSCTAFAHWEEKLPDTAHWTKEAPARKSLSPCFLKKPFNILLTRHICYLTPADNAEQCQTNTHRAAERGSGRPISRVQKTMMCWCMTIFALAVSSRYCITGVLNPSHTRPNTASLTLNPSRSQPEFYRSKCQERIAVFGSEFSQTTLFLSAPCDLGKEITFKTQLGHLKYRSLF